MPRFCSSWRDSLRLAAPGLAIAFAGFASGAQAQSSSCNEVGQTLNERKDIVAAVNALGQKKKLDARQACTVFTNLVGNGTKFLKWAEANKEWCQVPDSFIENIKADHAKVVNLKGQACKAVAQQAEMEKKARAAQQGQGSGLLGGDGLTGSYRMPQGAL